MQWKAIERYLDEPTKAYIRLWNYTPCCDSTNQQLLNLAKLRSESDNSDSEQVAANESIAGIVMVTDQQTQGRGRNNNAWHSNANESILFSLGMHLDDNALADSRAEMLSLIVGMAICQALQNLYDEDVDVGEDVAEDAKNITNIAPKLKWPNDIMLGSAKLAGILIESQYRKSKGMQLVIGVGVNVFAPVQADSRIEQKTASVYSHNGVADSEQNQQLRAKVLAAILNRLIYTINNFQNIAITEFIENWRALDFYQQEEILLVDTLNTHKGGTEKESYQEMTYKGIDDKGKIRFMDASGQWYMFNNTDIKIKKTW